MPNRAGRQRRPAGRQRRPALRPLLPAPERAETPFEVESRYVEDPGPSPYYFFDRRMARLIRAGQQEAEDEQYIRDMESNPDLEEQIFDDSEVESDADPTTTQRPRGHWRNYRCDICNYVLERQYIIGPDRDDIFILSSRCYNCVSMFSSLQPTLDDRSFQRLYAIIIRNYNTNRRRRMSTTRVQARWRARGRGVRINSRSVRNIPLGHWAREAQRREQEEESSSP
ncbi:hypothetical protein FPSE_12080 [Fusarium pseudograminearum CS3096]|uniref:Uncharacterized protein n=1 Tax=Fusarium pseudograminearum (strain CS3096) TaxID=1028729 RepID=K3V4F1_FUSPC|nr:hypothetical protein FPSE_12080 [Fusarium pseudograminearum CS3096]EKJ67709.1 hypothetical protein FPSE_12080 [Fusarium pseudograminearum CS3096]KAF0640047.1 hypothetical protein FPSE5266_12080 [Fusarium pseudograminearum]